ncbi:hypothetical protein PoB_004766700 [Plakobranchus ocellatus]|uniref:PHD-type domain-containing protein n=1 Tax=Plakobranchus ocellatus TaxID=259542 RepID=A0AAV4BP84_9GAST|nr:hypothetical protein PoB_004766700 [Plakobranchus ocellatus]
MRPKRATQVKKNVGLCPCICRESCSEESSNVECSSCKGWIHWRCVPMTHDLLEEWGEGGLQFTCRMCAFDNGAYSASKALENMSRQKSCVHMCMCGRLLRHDGPQWQGGYFLSKPLAKVVRGRGVSQRKNPAFILMWTCSFIPLTTNAFTPNHFVVLHDKLKSPVVDLTFVSVDDDHDDDSASATAAVACVGNDDEDDDTAAVADISDNGTVDYDEDEADD